MTWPGRIHVCTSADAIADESGRLLRDLSASAVAQRARFAIALAGGNTPRAIYSHLAQTAADSIDWAAWEVYFGDERACPPEDPSSNYAMSRATLLDHVAVPQEQIFRMPADDADLDAAARAYADTLTGTLGDPPVLDVVLLGLGENGHTASLFPGTAALDVSDTWCTRGLADYEPFDRLTLTYPAINAARCVIFFVTGGSKREALQGVLDGTVPAAGIHPAGDLHWFLDEAAAATLPPGVNPDAAPH